MRIALINLPYDNNYGGNLQRYALLRVLQDMGHEATYIDLRFYLPPNWPLMPLRIAKRIIWRLFLGSRFPILAEWNWYKEYRKEIAQTKPFYDDNIPHSYSVRTLADYKEYDQFDAIVVGSDQVWRKGMAHQHLSNLFMDFLPDTGKHKRIAYGVSLGTSTNEYTDEEIERLGACYRKFSAVSVREASALRLFETYGWTSPQAKVVLDPTLLLNAPEYARLMPVEAHHTELFCYILDMTRDKNEFVNVLAKQQGLELTIATISKDATLSVGQWLSNIYHAQSIVTDSFHGMIFSIIFHKPFVVISNKRRGLERFAHLLRLVGLSDRLIDEQTIGHEHDFKPINWTDVEQRLGVLRTESREFLADNIQPQRP